MTEHQHRERDYREQSYLRALQTLSEMTRQLQLEHEGRAQTEIARTLGLSRTTIWSRSRDLRRFGRKGINRAG